MLNPHRFGDYQLGELLGVGTVGSIYIATNVNTGERVALKILLPEVSQDKKISTRFEREMLILEKLHHPHVVAYYGGGEHDGRLYYTMEIVDGGTMKQILQDHGRLRWREVVECGRQVASALQHAHNNGIIHRDLKPSNLYLTEGGDIKLGDFGIARDTGAADLTADGITVGTYAYMSPEQIAGGKKTTPKSDLYSLGCVLFELLTGRPPFVGENFAQIFTQHLQSPPPTLASLGIPAPPQLEELIRQLLAKDPEDRPFNARYVQGVLDDILEQVDQGDLAAPAATAPAATAAADDAPPIIQRADLSKLVEEDRLNQVSWTGLLWMFAIAGAIIAAAWALHR